MYSEENVMKRVDEVLRTGARICRAFLKRVSPAHKADKNVYIHGSDAHGSESCDVAPPRMTAYLATYYCSDLSVFAEWGKEREMEIVTETERIVYSKRALPETYPTMIHAQ
jgi:hypothetical protein